MKGLMIKDFKLMWAQKMFFVLIFLLGIALIVVNKGVKSPLSKLLVRFRKIRTLCPVQESARKAECRRTE